VHALPRPMAGTVALPKSESILGISVSVMWKE
jgi:hypothetical protein